MSNKGTVLYRYGPVAWVWRVFIAFFFAIGVAGLVIAFRSGEPWGLVMATATLGPALFFGVVLAVRVERVGENGIRVSTLLFWRRHIRREELGLSRLRTEYINEDGVLHAPRLWVPVKHGLPFYFDLLGHIPDKQAFVAFFVAPPREK